jgi:hypothetical protein
MTPAKFDDTVFVRCGSRKLKGTEGRIEIDRDRPTRASSNCVAIGVSECSSGRGSERAGMHEC